MEKSKSVLTYRPLYIQYLTCGQQIWIMAEGTISWIQVVEVSVNDRVEPEGGRRSSVIKVELRVVTANLVQKNADL